MAKKKGGLGVLGFVALIVVALLVVQYLQHHHISVHLPHG